MTDESSHRSFDQLIDEAASVPIKGWDFSFNRGRTRDQPLPWDYHDEALTAVATAHRVLDVDTGGGEIFASLRPPEGSVALEPHLPNLSVAAEQLKPHGVTVRARPASRLPVGDNEFDLVLNRRGSLNPEETHRVLQPGGTLLTQQVAADNDIEFNHALGMKVEDDPGAPSGLRALTTSLRSTGLVITDAREAVVETRYLDVGAVVFQLRIVSWQVPGFDPGRHREQLRKIHDQIVANGGFDVRSRRFLIRAMKE